MHIIEAHILTELDGFIIALRFFEELEDSDITFEHEKYASDIQTLGDRTHYTYELTITSKRTKNLEPILKQLDMLFTEG